MAWGKIMEVRTAMQWRKAVRGHHSAGGQQGGEELGSGMWGGSLSQTRWHSQEVWYGPTGENV